jgi:tetrapyrrole methylase family protein/MazG family protein
MESRSFSDLVDLIARLRHPEEGCPWDRAQDHRSLRPYVLEEAHELIAAIDSGDDESIADELGDVLLQVVLHSQIASERGAFTVEDVIAAISEKLTRRHPHVFGDASDDLPSIHRRWQEIKGRENRKNAELPVLVRARKAVFALAKLEQLDRIEEEAFGVGEDPEERAGRRILRVVEQAWREGFDPELALRKALNRLERESAE